MGSTDQLLTEYIHSLFTVYALWRISRKYLADIHRFYFSVCAVTFGIGYIIPEGFSTLITILFSPGVAYCTDLTVWLRKASHSAIHWVAQRLLFYP